MSVLYLQTKSNIYKLVFNATVNFLGVDLYKIGVSIQKKREVVHTFGEYNYKNQ